MAAVLTAATALLALGGCARTVSHYWSAYASVGESLYLIRVTELQRPNLVRWGRSDFRTISSTSEVIALDLNGRVPVKRVGLIRTHGASSKPSSRDYVFVNEDGSVELWDHESLVQRLKSVADISCAGEIEFDQQESRTIYYWCQEEGLAYRFQPPFTHGTRFALGELFGVDRSYPYYRFFSSIDDPAMFIAVGKDRLFQLNSSGEGAPVEIERALPPHSSQATPVRDELIAITSSLRIHQILNQDGSARLVVVPQGRAPRVHVLPQEVVAYEQSDQSRYVIKRYLLTSELVIWVLKDAGVPHNLIHSLDLTSGEFQRTEFQSVRT